MNSRPALSPLRRRPEGRRVGPGLGGTRRNDAPGHRRPVPWMKPVSLAASPYTPHDLDAPPLPIAATGRPLRARPVWPLPFACVGSKTCGEGAPGQPSPEQGGRFRRATPSRPARLGPPVSRTHSQDAPSGPVLSPLAIHLARRPTSRPPASRQTPAPARHECVSYFLALPIPA